MAPVTWTNADTRSPLRKSLQDDERTPSPVQTHHCIVCDHDTRSRRVIDLAIDTIGDTFVCCRSHSVTDIRYAMSERVPATAQPLIDEFFLAELKDARVRRRAALFGLSPTKDG